MKEGQLVQKIQKSDMGNRNYFLKEKYRTLYAELLNRNKTGQGLVQPWALSAVVERPACSFAA